MARKRRARRHPADQLEPAPDPRGEETPDEPTRLSNSAARADLIRKSRAKIRRLESERDTHRAKVKDLNKDIGDEFRNLKNDLGFTRRDAEHSFVLLDAEEGVHNSTLDTMREIFAAHGLGFQSNFVEALEQEETGNGKTHQTREMPSHAEASEAEQLGYAAGNAGKDEDTNPYADGDPILRERWAQGWQRGQAELAAEMGAGKEDESEAEPAPVH